MAATVPARSINAPNVLNHLLIIVMVRQKQRFKPLSSALVAGAAVIKFEVVATLKGAV